MAHNAYQQGHTNFKVQSRQTTRYHLPPWTTRRHHPFWNRDSINHFQTGLQLSSGNEGFRLLGQCTSLPNTYQTLYTVPEGFEAYVEIHYHSQSPTYDTIWINYFPADTFMRLGSADFINPSVNDKTTALVYRFNIEANRTFQLPPLPMGPGESIRVRGTGQGLTRFQAMGIESSVT